MECSFSTGKSARVSEKLFPGRSRGDAGQDESSCLVSASLRDRKGINRTGRSSDERVGTKIQGGNRQIGAAYEEEMSHPVHVLRLEPPYTFPRLTDAALDTSPGVA